LAARYHVPLVAKDAIKFWWNEEMRDLKHAAVVANRKWIALGRPKQGPIFEDRQKTRRLYRLRIKVNKKEKNIVYTNDLHDALVRKDSNRFWKAWKRNFEHILPTPPINGTQNDIELTDNFKCFFASMAEKSVSPRSVVLHTDFVERKNGYIGDDINVNDCFSVESLSRCIMEFKRGRACGLDLISAEHVQNAHPLIVVILSKLFKIILSTAVIPFSFTASYTVPIPKSSSSVGRVLTCADFRGITINTFFSKLFEKGILHDFASYFSSDPRQFGFKLKSGCAHAIYSVRKIVEFYNAGESTASICSVDIAKAFPSVNHDFIFSKLIQRSVPKIFLTLLEKWYSNCYSCVKWKDLFSDYYQIHVGVLQGSCLAPALFTLCMDEVILCCMARKIGHIIAYADDVILIARSVTALQELLLIVENSLLGMDYGSI
jgi:hypothetical protein